MDATPAGRALPDRPPPVPRRRRSREVARAEILAAAEAVLAERPFRELNVEEVMGRTSLSRSSFYVYFRDRHDLLLALVGQIGDEIYGVADAWYHGGEDHRRDMLDGLSGVVEVYRRHGLVLRAVSDAASVDPQAEEVYGALVWRFVEASSQRIREEVDRGRISGLHPEETAYALVLMTERYLSTSFGTVETRVSPERAIETLHRIWLRTLY